MKKVIIFLSIISPSFLFGQDQIDFFKNPLLTPRYGGIGLYSYTGGDILQASGQSTIAKIGIGSALQIPRINAGGTAIEYFTATYMTGTLTSGYLPKATGANAVANSLIYDNGTQVAFGTVSPTGSVPFSIHSAVGGTILEVRNPSGNVAYFSITDNSTGAGDSNGMLFGYNGGALILNRENTPTYFSTNDVTRWIIAAAGHFTAGADNSYDIGASGATRPRTGYFGTSVLSPIFNAATGYQVAGAATSGNYLRGNGTNFVSSAIQAGDIPDLSATYLKHGANTLTQNTTFNGTFDWRMGNSTALDTVEVVAARWLGGTATSRWSIGSDFSRLYSAGTIAYQVNNSNLVHSAVIADNQTTAYQVTISGGNTAVAVKSTDDDEQLTLGAATMPVSIAQELKMNKTVTAAATTGAQTINKPAGTVNFAAAATSLVVTNSLVTANSIILCTIGTNDATMTSVQAVAGSGSFTIHANAAATAETRVNFLVIN